VGRQAYVANRECETCGRAPVEASSLTNESDKNYVLVTSTSGDADQARGGEVSRLTLTTEYQAHM
jgi:hypothetical protein